MDDPPEESLEERLDQLEQKITNVHELILERLDPAPSISFSDGIPEKKAKRFPLNVKEISLDEIFAFYNECFLTPEYEGKIPVDGSKLDTKKLNDVFWEYRKEATYAVSEQAGNMDKFLEHVAGQLLGQASKTNIRCPLVFAHQGDYYQLLGYSVVDKCIISQVSGFFRYKPVAECCKEKVGDMSEDDIFKKYVLDNPKIRTAWADVVAYSILVGMDLKEGRYVDRKRSKVNMATFEALKCSAARVLIDHMKPSSS
jgi:hypothetical protein